jgi:tetratricopeptide (TPR) repeat protein
VKHLRLISLLFLSLSFYLRSENSGFEYFKPENICSFAEYLFNEGQYERAVGEYQRLLFSSDSFPSRTDSIFFKIALCYRFAEKYKESIGYFQKIVNEYSRSDLVDKAYFEMGLNYSFVDSFKQSNKILKAHFLQDSLKNIDIRIRKLITLNHIQQKEWDKAEYFLYDEDTLRGGLSVFIETGQNLPGKNPFVSGVFSAVIPGAGKFYCGRPADGFHSLVTVGITGWQAYEGFKADGVHSVKGWIFGVVGGIFYLGNIYGSVVAADIYNEEQEVFFRISVNKYLNENFK